MQQSGSRQSSGAVVEEDLREQYWRDGYVIVPNLLAPDHIERLKARARDFALGKLPAGAEKMVVRDARVAKGEIKVEDPEKGMWKYLNPDRYDSLFHDYPATPAILDVVEMLLGPDFKAFLTMFIYKPPGIDEAIHPYHQDSFYFPFGPHDQVLGTWIALDPTDAENGTLSVIRGSHRMALQKHVAPDTLSAKAGVFGIEGYEGHPDEVFVNLQPGDGLFFHSRLLHRAGPNTSQRHRRVLTVHYASAECKFEGTVNSALDFRLVRGRNHEGCI